MRDLIQRLLRRKPPVPVYADGTLVMDGTALMYARQAAIPALHYPSWKQSATEQGVRVTHEVRMRHEYAVAYLVPVPTMGD